MSTTQDSEVSVGQLLSVADRVACHFGTDDTEMFKRSLHDVFSQGARRPLNDSEFFSMLVVMDRYKLNPFVNELRAVNTPESRVVPQVGYDGWVRIANEHEQFDGVEFRFADTSIKIGNSKSCPEWIECAIHRKDRSKPIVVREYFEECYHEIQGGSAWDTHPRRMLRTKVFNQAVRLAFSISGIYDPDEVQRIEQAQQSARTVVKADFGSSKPQPRLNNTTPTRDAKPLKESTPAIQPVLSREVLEQRIPKDRTARIQTFVGNLLKRVGTGASTASCMDLIKARHKGDELPYASMLFDDGLKAQAKSAVEEGAEDAHIVADSTPDIPVDEPAPVEAPAEAVTAEATVTEQEPANAEVEELAPVNAEAPTDPQEIADAIDSLEQRIDYEVRLKIDDTLDQLIAYVLEGGDQSACMAQINNNLSGDQLQYAQLVFAAGLQASLQDAANEAEMDRAAS